MRTVSLVGWCSRCSNVAPAILSRSTHIKVVPDVKQSWFGKAGILKEVTNNEEFVRRGCGAA